MTTTLSIKKRQPLPWHGWFLGIILFLFGCFSVYDYIRSIAHGEDFYRDSGMTDSQVKYYMNFPAWAIAAWTLSVWGMFLASASLLLRLKFAITLFIISLAGSLVYILYVFGLSNGIDAMGMIWPAPIVVAVITVAMIFYCIKLAREKVLS